MKIKRIKRLQKYGIFRDFSGDALPEFAEFNLIYGPNWSGKTTLSRMLRNLEQQEVPDGEVLIATDESNNIRGDDFPSTNIPIHVFNNDFVKDNVFLIDEDKDIPPIIIIGTEDKEKRDQLEEKERFREDAQREHNDKQVHLTDIEMKLDNHCRERGQTIKGVMRKSGENKYNSYNKVNYRKQAEIMLDEGNKNSYMCEEEEEDVLVQKFNMYRAVSKPEIPKPEYPQLDLAVLQRKIVALLARTVVAGTIQSLKDDPKRAEWVRRGFDFQIERKCPFCEQQVPERRQLELEGHFNTEYEQLIKSLNELAAEIDNIKKYDLRKIEAPNNVKIHECLFDAYEKAKANLKFYHDQVEKYLESLAEAINRKKGQPFDVVLIDDVIQPPDDNPKEDLIKIIHQHNDTCKDHTKKVDEAGKWLVCRYVAENLEEFRHMRYAETDAKKIVVKSKKRVITLDAEVSRLKHEISDHRRSADMFNADLSAYLGHEELRLDVRENGYIIVSKGNEKPLPSEGEKTAIALLYFLTSLQRDGFDIKKSIIVLDDPVSSLDASSLFAAYGFIRKHTNSAGQLFILTHNFTFFREVREWFDNKNRRNKPKRAQFYMLDSMLDDQGRRSEIRELDQLLRDYGSDYHYLFARVWHYSQQTDKLESYYPLPNMARRLLEAFLAFRRPDIHGTLGDRMDNIDFDEGKKLRILAFVNAHSHNDTVAGPEHSTEILSETPKVLADIINLIKCVDLNHYNCMVKLISKTLEK